jgi:uncharacterized membrane protein YfcA
MELTLTLILILGLVVFITQGLEGVTGFGSTVLALPFLAMILGIDKAVPILAAHTWLLAGYFVVVNWKHIVWKEFRFIVLHVLIGLPIGYLLFKNLDDTYLKVLLSLFMIGVGINGIRVTRHSRRAKASTEPVKKSLLMRFILFLGGIIHGAFASGGPFIVLYASKALKDKTLFRVSMCLLWLCLNTILMMVYILDGTWTADTRYALYISLPFLFAGIFVGDYLHHRVSEYVFRLVVFALLVAGGFVVMYGVAGKLLASNQNNAAHNLQNVTVDVMIPGNKNVALSQKPFLIPQTGVLLNDKESRIPTGKNGSLGIGVAVCDYRHDLPERFGTHRRSIVARRNLGDTVLSVDEH